MNGSFFNPNLAGSLSYGLAGSALNEMTNDMDASSLYIHELHQRKMMNRHTSPAFPAPSSSGSGSLYRPMRGVPHHTHPESAMQTTYGAGGVDQHSENYSEPRYQQAPLHGVRGSHFVSAVGRGRSTSLLHGPPGGFTRVAPGQFEEVAEEEEQEHETQHQSIPRTLITNPNAAGSVGTKDMMPIWPDLPPPTC